MLCESRGGRPGLPVPAYGLCGLKATLNVRLNPLVFRLSVVADDDVVELHVLGCRVDILGTNCDQCLSMVQCCFTSTETVRFI